MCLSSVLSVTRRECQVILARSDGVLCLLLNGKARTRPKAQYRARPSIREGVPTCALLISVYVLGILQESMLMGPVELVQLALGHDHHGGPGARARGATSSGARQLCLSPP